MTGRLKLLLILVFGLILQNVRTQEIPFPRGMKSDSTRAKAKSRAMTSSAKTEGPRISIKD